jgi:hypothetical protein
MVDLALDFDRSDQSGYQFFNDGQSYAETHWVRRLNFIKTIKNKIYPWILWGYPIPYLFLNSLWLEDQIKGRQDKKEISGQGERRDPRTYSETTTIGFNPPEIGHQHDRHK